MPQTLDKYKIFEKLGEGATAEVYHASDVALDRELLKPTLYTD